jgi:hypothetical protein
LGQVKRKWRQGRASKNEVKEAKRVWQRAIREAKRRCWEEVLDSSVGMEVWTAVRYTKAEKVMVVPTLVGVDGTVANTMEAKSKMLAEIVFPPPVECNGRSGEEGEQGGAFGYVEEDTVRKAIFAMSGKKAPGPDGIGASVIRLLWEWDSARITALVRASIRLGAHSKTWKIAKGVTIPKPGKDDYSKVKSYRVISLLNCLGKVVKKVVAIMLTDHCKWHRTFHLGQYGCRRNRSAVDAIGVLMVKT